MIMMMWMMGGMIVLNETSYYSYASLAIIAMSFCISCIGIKVLTMKIKQQRTEKIATESLKDGSDSSSINRSFANQDNGNKYLK